MCHDTMIERCHADGVEGDGVGSESLWKKRNLQCEGHFSKLQHFFAISNGENAQKLVSDQVLRYHDDPTIKESEIIIFTKIDLSVCGKKRRCWEGKRENEIERRCKVLVTPM